MRKWLSITTAIIIFLLIVAIAGLWQFNRALTSAGVDNLHYQLETINLQGVQLSEVSFVYSSSSVSHSIQVRNLRVDWQLQKFSLRLNAISIEQLKLKRLTETLQKPLEEKELPAFKLPVDWRIPAAFPQKVHLKALIYEQPCSAGICAIAAQATLFSSARENVHLEIIASPGKQIDLHHQLQITADYRVKNNLPDVVAKFSLDQDIHVQLASHLENQTELDWLGSLKGTVKYPNDWWLSHLQSWGINSLDLSFHSIAAAALDIDTNWQMLLTPLLQVQARDDINQYAKALSGSWQLDAKIPRDFPIPGIGRFAGAAKVDIGMERGQLKRYSLLADISARELSLPESIKHYGLDVNQAHINVQSKEENTESLAALPITFSADVQGGLTGNVSGHLLLDLLSKKIIADRFAAVANANRLNPYGDIELKNINLDVQAIGYWQPEGFSFNVVQPVKASADISSKSLAFSAKSTRVQADNLRIAGNYNQGTLVLPELAVDSEGTINIEKLSHEQLKASAWRWQGKTKGALGNFDLKGDLTIGSAFTLNHHATLSQAKLIAQWKLADIFLLAANPFADTLTAWPPLLSLARGKLSAQGKLEYNLERNMLEKSESNLHLQDIAGIYDTTAFEGLNTKAVMTTANKTFKVVSDDLKLNQLNKGFLLGPLQAQVSYQAAWQKPFEGKLALKQFNVMVAQGNVTTPAQNFDLSKPSQRFLVNLKQVSLTNLLQQYPTSELSGSGQLSGSIPVEITKKGLRIDKGNVAAEAPGGKLKYQSARANELAKSQPSMKLLTEALNDFNYSVLSSEVNYDETGKLILAVRLEGSNPKLEKGRPIHFNINFEEDIPAMLASIQLSSKVSDVIKKRVQDYMQRKPESDVISIKK